MNISMDEQIRRNMFESEENEMSEMADGGDEKDKSDSEKNSTPWMDYAKKEIGTKELDPGDNPRIIEYLNTAGNSSTKDETPWCASFAHWCLKNSGIKGAGPVGFNWSSWGDSIEKPAYGAIAVFKTGHIGFVAGETKDGKLVMLHGNWSNRVDLSTYGISKSEIKEYRYPTGYTPNYSLPKYGK